MAPEIPFDLMIEILRRLPAKSLMRFKCVSKLWSGVIRSKYFSNLYYLTMKVSSSLPSREPLLLYMNCCPKVELLSFTISKSSPSNSVESSSWQEPHFTIEGMGVHNIVFLRGLILNTFGRKACIYNPTTRQSLTLPAVKSNIFAQPPEQLCDEHVYYFFGHDPVLDQYKIVCNVIDRRITSSEFWVFVLEPGGGFWKRIEDDDKPHVPTEERALCINGVIYYLASNSTCIGMVYCFDVRSEKFRVIKAPQHEVSEFDKCVCFVEYGGKPALFDYTHIRETGVSELWVLEEDGLGCGTWSRKSLDLKPCQRHYFVDDDLMGWLLARGTDQNNEVILRSPHSCYLLYYDLINNNVRLISLKKGRTIMSSTWKLDYHYLIVFCSIIIIQL